MSDLILYTTEDGQTRMQLRVEGKTVWLTQLEIAELFRTTKQNVSLHANNIFAEGELSADSVVKESLTTAADGKQYRTQHFNLDLIIAIGLRVRSPRGTQFRQWATTHLREYIVKGFLLDDERLKNPGGWDHFDELLARIREIRASEKRFYQKVRDLFALSSDYENREKETHLFFAEAQNKLLYAATGQTAAELIVTRADAAKPNMALTSWTGSRVRKQDVIIAKNYLTQDEIDMLNRPMFFSGKKCVSERISTLTGADVKRGGIYCTIPPFPPNLGPWNRSSPAGRMCLATISTRTRSSRRSIFRLIRRCPRSGSFLGCMR